MTVFTLFVFHVSLVSSVKMVHAFWIIMRVRSPDKPNWVFNPSLMLILLWMSIRLSIIIRIHFFNVKTKKINKMNEIGALHFFGFCLIYYCFVRALGLLTRLAIVVANIDFSLYCGMERYTMIRLFMKYSGKKLRLFSRIIFHRD